GRCQDAETGYPWSSKPSDAVPRRKGEVPMGTGRASRDARERWIPTDGVELCVAELGTRTDEDGGRRPTVVLLHGYPDTKELWYPVAERLAPRFHVVLYDVRGFGKSTAPDPP